MQRLEQYVDHLESTLINSRYVRLELRSPIEQVLALLSRKNREAQGLQGGQTVDVSIFERHVLLFLANLHTGITSLIVSSSMSAPIQYDQPHGRYNP